MSLLLIAPPADEPVSLADLKAHLRVTESAEDGLIAASARAARRAVEARGGLSLLAQGWRLVFDAPPRSVLTLPRSPVFAIDAVETISRDGVASPVDPDLYDAETGAVARLRARGPWPRSDAAIGGVRIDFTAGWPEADAVPDELKHAVLMLAAHFYENREGLRPERLFAVPQAVDALIAPYRSLRL